MDLHQEAGACQRHTRAPVLDERGIAEHIGRLAGWSIDNTRLVKSYHFDTANEAVVFVNRVSATAQARNHHPHVHWWKRDVRIELWTHKANGLTIRDFEFAACCDSFASVQGQDSIPTPKPHPGHLLAVLAELGVEPELAVMVGDSEQDVSKARAARVQVVLITRGRADVPCAGGPD